MTGDRIFTIQNENVGFSVIWSLYALFVPDLFDRYPKLYLPMLELAPQVTWGLLVMSFGVIASVAIGFGYRKVASLILGALYVFFAVLYYHGDTHSPGGGLYLWLGAFNIFFTLGGLIWTHRQT